MSSAPQADERAPLLQRTAEEQQAQEENAAASAIQSGIAFDPNASAFAPQSYLEPHPEEGEEDQPGGPLVREAPLRSDLFIILGGMWIGTFLAALDGTIVATILSTIGSEFGVSQSISWLGTSYLLTQTAFQPLYGRFSDIFGRKAATLFASVVFLLGSLACGLSRSFPMLIASRAFAGIGGGGLTTMSSIVTSDLIPLKQRGVYQGLGNLVYAAGAAIGGPLGGLLGDTIGWKWAFLIQVPLCVVHFVVVSWKVDIPSGPGSIISKLKRIDVFGALFLVGAVTLFLVGMSLGGNELPWSAPEVWVSILVSLVLLAGFGVVEGKIAREPIMPLRVLFERTPLGVSLTNWFISMSQFGIIYNVPLYFSAVQQTTTSQAGLHLIPNAVFASAASLACGIIMSRTGKYKTMLITSGALGAIGPIWMITWSRARNLSVEGYFTMIPGGIGYGAILTITLVALISAVDPKDMAAATGVSYLFRATGSVLGISVTSAILQNSLKKELPKYIHGKDASHIIAEVRRDVAYIRTLKGSIREGAIDAYQDSMRLTFVMIAIFGFLAFLSQFLIKQHHLPGTLDRKK